MEVKDAQGMEVKDAQGTLITRKMLGITASTLLKDVGALVVPGSLHYPSGSDRKEYNVGADDSAPPPGGLFIFTPSNYPGQPWTHV